MHLTTSTSKNLALKTPLYHLTMVSYGDLFVGAQVPKLIPWLKGIYGQFRFLE